MNAKFSDINRPLHPYQVRHVLREISRDTSVDEFTHKEWGVLVGYMNRYCGGDDKRRMILRWLFGDITSNNLMPMSSKELKPQDKYAIKEWVSAYQIEDGIWAPISYFIEEAKTVADIAIKECIGGYNTDITHIEIAMRAGGVLKRMDNELLDSDITLDNISCVI